MDQSISVSQKKRGRPATGSDRVVTLRIPKDMIGELEAYAVAEGQGRSEAIRFILADWLRTHGLSSHRGPKPIGPATDAVKAMDAAITKDRSGGKRLASIKETGEEVP